MHAWVDRTDLPLEANFFEVATLGEAWCVRVNHNQTDTMSSLPRTPKSLDNSRKYLQQSNLNRSPTFLAVGSVLATTITVSHSYDDVILRV